MEVKNRINDGHSLLTLIIVMISILLFSPVSSLSLSAELSLLAILGSYALAIVIIWSLEKYMSNELIAVLNPLLIVCNVIVVVSVILCMWYG